MFKKRSSTSVSKSAKKIDLDGIHPAIYARRWWVLAALCLSLLGVMLANSSLNMALPMMARDLTLDQLQLTWIVNIYTLVFASLLFTAGALGDRYGRKLALQIGLGIFVGGSLYAGFLAQTGFANLYKARHGCRHDVDDTFCHMLFILSNTYRQINLSLHVPPHWTHRANPSMLFQCTGSIVITSRLM